jgi:hypothetical protein
MPQAPSIRWGRVVIAAVMSEVGVIATLFAGIAAYTLVTPGMSDADSSQLGEQVGYYVAPTSGAIMTFLAVVWATRPLVTAFVAHGWLVGLASVLLTAGFIFGARPDHRLMYVIAFALRLLGGYAGGVFAQWKFRAGTTGAAVMRETP